MSYNELMRRVGAASETASSTVSRRGFMKVAGVAGLALGFAPQMVTTSAHAADAALKPQQAPNAFVQIAPDGTVTVQINRLEFGQGSHTGLARVLADELDADWKDVRAELAPAGEAYKDPAFGIQMTGGSNSIQNSFVQYRELGARARAMLIAAAAEQWGVSASEVSTKDGRLMGPGGKSLGYGDVAAAAQSQEVPATVTLKPADQFKFIGKSVGRLDAADKSTGQQNFGIDASRPGMKTVLIARPPQFGGKVAKLDDAAARKVRGVVDVMRVPLDRGAEGVAVVADGYWPANQGRAALNVEWSRPAAVSDTASETAAYSAMLDKPGLPARKGDTSALSSAAKVIEAEFTFPFLAHAPMEPLNAVIDVSGTGAEQKVEIWTGTQFQTIDQGTVAAVMGVKPQQVEIHTQFAGGGFGRRATPTADYLADTARVMKTWLGAGQTAPLKLVWSREDDVRGGYYRPFTMHKARIGLDDNGNVTAWKHSIASPSILTGTAFEAFLVKDGVDHTAVEGVADTAYPLPIAVDVHHPKSPVPILWWRSVGHTHSAFVMETLIDEVAAAGGQDPVEYRRKMLAKHPRHIAALNLAVEKSGYGKKKLPEGHAFGVAVHASFNSVMAYVVEASVENGAPKVHHVTGALHCNLAVNPSSVVTQVQGAAIMGIGMTLPGAQITLKDGVVEQGNFDTFRVPRMTDTPPIDVHIVPSGDAPTGVGEPGLPPIAPAIANAVRAATGKSLRSMPFETV